MKRDVRGPLQEWLGLDNYDYGRFRNNENSVRITGLSLLLCIAQALERIEAKIGAAPEAAPDPRYSLVVKERLFGHASHTTIEDKFCSIEQAEDYALHYFRNHQRTGKYEVWDSRARNIALVKEGEWEWRRREDC